MTFERMTDKELHDTYHGADVLSLNYLAREHNKISKYCAWIKYRASLMLLANELERLRAS